MTVSGELQPGAADAAERQNRGDTARRRNPSLGLTWPYSVGCQLATNDGSWSGSCRSGRSTDFEVAFRPICAKLM